jgi:hypothetical protein
MSSLCAAADFRQCTTLSNVSRATARRRKLPSPFRPYVVQSSQRCLTIRPFVLWSSFPPVVLAPWQRRSLPSSQLASQKKSAVMGLAVHCGQKKGKEATEAKINSGKSENALISQAPVFHLPSSSVRPRSQDQTRQSRNSPPGSPRSLRGKDTLRNLEKRSKGPRREPARWQTFNEAQFMAHDSRN